MTDFATNMCLACAAGLLEECLNPEILNEDGETWIIPCAVEFVIGVAAEPKGQAGRPVKDGDFKDPLSTGRKRAAMLYPILPNMVCEWAGLKAAGGGVVPIVGCDWNIIQPIKSPIGGDVHHGPSKSVLRNDPGNAHRICKSCHHTWHAKNDKFYPGERPADGGDWFPEGAWVPHDPTTEATEEEIEEANLGRDSQNERASDAQISAIRTQRAVRSGAFFAEGEAANPFSDVGDGLPSPE